MFWGLGHLNINVVGNVLAGREMIFGGRCGMEMNSDRHSGFIFLCMNWYPVVPELHVPIPGKEDRLGRVARGSVRLWFLRSMDWTVPSKGTPCTGPG